MKVKMAKFGQSVKLGSTGSEQISINTNTPEFKDWKMELKGATLEVRDPKNKKEVFIVSVANVAYMIIDEAQFEQGTEGTSRGAGRPAKAT